MNEQEMETAKRLTGDPLPLLIEGIVSVATSRGEFTFASAILFLGTIWHTGDTELLQAAACNLSELASTAIEEIEE